ncbi:MAG TPA: GNAT family N-acetyltransferase [Herpetosiphonaceae bacterium]
MSIQLEPITRENWYACSQLDVKPEQRPFVSSNLLCIAEMQFYPAWGAYAISSGEQMVGFVMYEHEQEQDEWWISALMIAADHQGRGYGKAAIRELIAVMQQKGCREVLVGYADDNRVARVLYHSLGFQEIGLDDEGDMVARLCLTNTAVD